MDYTNFPPRMPKSLFEIDHKNLIIEKIVLPNDRVVYTIDNFFLRPKDVEYHLQECRRSSTFNNDFYLEMNLQMKEHIDELKKLLLQQNPDLILNGSFILHDYIVGKILTEDINIESNSKFFTSRYNCLSAIFCSDDANVDVSFYKSDNEHIDNYGPKSFVHIANKFSEHVSDSTNSPSTFSNPFQNYQLYHSMKMKSNRIIIYDGDLINSFHITNVNPEQSAATLYYSIAMQWESSQTEYLETVKFKELTKPLMQKYGKDISSAFGF